jgi:hypothetical protein
MHFIQWVDALTEGNGALRAARSLGARFLSNELGIDFIEVAAAGVRRALVGRLRCQTHKTKHFAVQ